MTDFKLPIVVGIVLCILFGPAAQISTASQTVPTGPLTLDQCIDIALERHPLLQSARHQIANAEAGIRVSKSAALPQVALTGGYTQNNGQPAGGIVSSLQEGFSAGVAVKQLIFDSGRTAAAIRDARYTLSASNAGYSDAEQSIILGVRQSYYGVLATEQFADAQAKARDLSELHVKEARARHAEGIAPKADVTKAEVELTNAELGLIHARNSVSLAYASLNNALGLPITTTLKLDGQFLRQEGQPSLEDSLSAAYRNRPELKRIEAQIQSAQAEIQVAGSATKPALYLTGGDIWPRTIGGIRSDGETTWTVGLIASMNLWDGGSAKARVQQARENVGMLEAGLANEKQLVGLDVHQAYLNVIEADQRAVTAVKLVSQAEENYRIAQGRYKEGVGPMIDVVDAETALTAARTSHVQAVLDSLVSRARLDKATGRELSQRGTTDEK